MKEKKIDIGDIVQYCNQGRYEVVGLSTMIPCDDGEPEWKVTHIVQEVAIVDVSEETTYQKPCWVSVKSASLAPIKDKTYCNYCESELGVESHAKDCPAIKDKEDSYICDNCGKTAPDWRSYEHDGITWCSDCYGKPKEDTTEKLYTQEQAEWIYALGRKEGALEEYKFWIPLSCERLGENPQGTRYGYRLTRDFVSGRRRSLEEVKETKVNKGGV